MFFLPKQSNSSFGRQEVLKRIKDMTQSFFSDTLHSPWALKLSLSSLLYSPVTRQICHRVWQHQPFIPQGNVEGTQWKSSVLSWILGSSLSNLWLTGASLQRVTFECQKVTYAKDWNIRHLFKDWLSLYDKDLLEKISLFFQLCLYSQIVWKIIRFILPLHID